MKLLPSPRLSLLSAMFLFGTIGVCVRYIPYPAALIALVRGLVGAVFLLSAAFIQGRRPSFPALLQNRKCLLAAGIAVGMNWILLFEAFRHTTVAIATICYYTAPVFVILLSPIFLRERLTLARLLCAFTALPGIALLSGLWDNGSAVQTEGVLFGLGAALFYASIVFFNKKLAGISSADATIAQLAAASLVLFPYVLASTDWSMLTAEPFPLILLLTLGIVHTGLAYLMYFSSLQGLSAQSAAIFSYLDPLTAVFLSIVFLGEPFSPVTFAGAVLILSATLASEIFCRSR